MKQFNQDTGFSEKMPKGALVELSKSIFQEYIDKMQGVKSNESADIGTV